MSREVKQDFDSLKKFIADYNLENVANDKSLLPIFSKIHKKYFGLLALLIELNSQSIHSNSFIANKDRKDYLFESLSDLGNSFFLIFNGGYKASKLMLRSSIETFIKGISVDELPAIINEKRVSVIFGEVSKLDLFSQNPLTNELSSLKTKYSDLCEDTHTASKVNMQHISALNYFPTKDTQTVEKISNIFVSLIQTYIFIITMKFNKEFHQIHHGNKSIIVKTIKKAHRPITMNIN